MTTFKRYPSASGTAFTTSISAGMFLYGSRMLLRPLWMLLNGL